jgi:methylmalonyl-CoA mutase C-terminal domain/subunit
MVTTEVSKLLPAFCVMLAWIGLSMLSGAHMTLAPLVVEALRSRGSTIPVVVGGIVPRQDIALLKEAGIAEVLGPGAPGTAVVDTIRAAANAS